MRLMDILENRNLGLTIFDIDETLFRTTAQIKVVKNGQVIRSLTNQEFNNYELQPGEDFDFGEFKDAQKFNRESIPIAPMIAKLKAILRNAGDSKVIMLTARSDFDNKHLFLDTFRKYGIDIDRIHVHRAGNLGGSPAENKEVFIRQYLDTGDYARIRLYDDSMTNIRMFASLAKEYPNVKFFPYFVTHEGGIKTIREDGRIVKGVNTTVDVGPDEIKIQAAKFGNTVDRDGKPPTMSKSVKGKSTNVLFNLGLVENVAPNIKKNYTDFVKFCCEFLELERQPLIRLTDDIFEDTFGYFNSEDDSITVSYNRRHQMDVMRTIAHELTHYRQRLDGEDLDGSDGSVHENEANAFAGVMLRQWADKNPHLFSENKFTDYELALMEGGHSPEPKKKKTAGQIFSALSEYELEDRHPNEPPFGPEFKPTMPSGTIRVKVSDVYDWYKLGQHISNLPALDKNDFGEGPPEAIISFGSEDEEHKYIKLLSKLGLEIIDVDPSKHKIKGIKSDDTYNLGNKKANEAFDTDVEWVKDMDNGGIQVFATKVDDAYIELTYKRMTNDDVYIAFSRGGRSSVTGEGGQNKIFGAVINHIQKWTSANKPPRIVFSAFKPNTGAFGSQDTTRSSLYRRMVQRFAGQNGYEYDVEDTGNEDTFILTKQNVEENFADGKVKGKSKPGRVKKSGASCKGSVTDLRKRAKKYSGERGRMYHWCANMKSGRKKN